LSDVVRPVELSAALSGLVHICRKSGERFDLVQAGGGNASFRSADQRLYVKGSGLMLSEVTDRSFAELDNNALLEVVSDLSQRWENLPYSELEKIAQEATMKACRNEQRPSIEALSHAVLGPFTLHTHPVAVMSLVCRPDWQSRAREILPSAHLLPYTTPGILLALSLYTVSHGAFAFDAPMIALIQNHGLFVAARSAEESFEVTNYVVETISAGLGMNLSRYVICNEVSNLVFAATGIELCAYLCGDAELIELIKVRPEAVLCRSAVPDHAVYCGPDALVLESLDDQRPIVDYVEAYRQAPKVVLFGSHLFFLGANVRKCMEVQEVLKAHALALKEILPLTPVHHLEQSEVARLLNWEAERYRQQQ